LLFKESMEATPQVRDALMRIQTEYIEMPDKLKNQYQYFTQSDLSKLKNAGCPVSFRNLDKGVEDYVKNYLEKPHPYL